MVFIRDMNGWAILSWIESVPENGPSTKAEAKDVGEFTIVESFKGNLPLSYLIFSSSFSWGLSSFLRSIYGSEQR